jgi:hypothetical protein
MLHLTMPCAPGRVYAIIVSGGDRDAYATREKST